MNKSAAATAIAGVLMLAGCTAAPAAQPPTTLDRTSEVRAAAGEHVISALEVEPGRVNVATDLVDPRGENGSPAALAAISICEAVVKLPHVEHVTVAESDGTAFVLYGHPAVGNVCAEA